jgi:multidrug resistance efflux pump
VIRSLRRAWDRVFDWLSARPLSFIVFAGSVAALVYLQSIGAGQFRARAVAQAATVEHPALVASYVTNVFVRRGDRVEAGAPLVELSSFFIDQELERIDTRIVEMLREARLAQTELLVDEERWLDPSLRSRPSEPSLEQPTGELFAAELRVLQTERSHLEQRRERLTIHSVQTGRVASVVPAGGSVAIGTSVAAVVPEYADEIVAYIPPETDPSRIDAGAPVSIVQPPLLCDGEGEVLRRGAAVEEAPGQLTQFFRLPVYGMPVYISVPTDCSIAVGQVLAVEIARATM